MRALLLPALSAVALAAAPAPRPPNVVLVIVDDLRADRLGAYGAAKPTPRFDALAAESAVFERAYAQAGWTLPSVSSILTGLYPTVHGARRALPGDWSDQLARKRLRVQPGSRLPETRLTLAQALRERGYRTEAVVSCPFGDPAFGFARGFDDYWSAGGSFADVTAEVARRLPRLKDGPPFFLYVHMVDAHVDGEGAEMAATTAAGAARAAADYDVGVSSADAGLGRLVDALRSAGVLDKSLLFVTSDHGEEIGERGFRGHGTSPYEAALRVPLLVRRPGGKPARVAGVARGIDLFPTALDLAGLPPAPGLEGESLRPGLETGRLPPRVAFTEIYPPMPAYGADLAAVAARGERWTYIRRSDGREELYDAAKDPREREDLAAREPVALKDQRARTEEWRREVARAAAAQAPIPGEERFLPPEEAARLRRAGYLK